MLILSPFFVTPTCICVHHTCIITIILHRSTMIRRMLDSLELSLLPSPPPISHVSSLITSDHKLGGTYKPLLSRPTSGTFEERYEVHKDKKRIALSDRGEQEH